LIANGEKDKIKIHRQIVKHSIGLQHICMSVLSDAVEKNVLKYSVSEIVKGYYEDGVFKEYYQEFDIPYDEKNFNWLNDTYQYLLDRKIIKKN